jgi:RNase H-fold protein (predicted Holliday junction resolvase)
MAQRLRQETGSRKKKGIVRYDAMAAAVILQDYLEEQALKQQRENGV